MSTSTTQTETLGDNAQLIALVNPILVTRPYVSYLVSNGGLVASLADLGSKINDGTVTRNDYIDVVKDIGAIGTSFAALIEAGGLLAAGTVLPWAIGIGLGLAALDYADEHGYDTGDMIDGLNDMLDNAKGSLAGAAWGMADAVGDLFGSAQGWAGGGGDPLVFDMDADGIEILPINVDSPVLFDFENDGVKTATGWVKSDDALLVLDRNSNGTIDNGSELFGDQTLVNGVKTTDGFAALSAEDTNGDGVFDANDTNFNNVRVWQDLNQNDSMFVSFIKPISNNSLYKANIKKMA